MSGYAPLEDGWNARFILRTFAGELVLGGATIDLRHVKLAPGKWFAADLDASLADDGAVVVSWGEGPQATLRQGDRLSVGGVEISTGDPLDSPVNAERATLKLSIQRNGGVCEAVAVPLVAERTLRRHGELHRTAFLGSERGRLRWLAEQLEENDAPIESRTALRDALSAARIAHKAIDASEKEIADGIRKWSVQLTNDSLHVWRDYLKAHEAAREAIEAAVKFGYAMATAEAAMGLVPLAADGQHRKIRAKQNSEKANAGRLRTDLRDDAAGIWRDHPTWSLTRVAKAVKKDGDEVSNVIATIRSLMPAASASATRRKNT